MDQNEINRRHDYYAPDENTRQLHQDWRDSIKIVAQQIAQFTDSQETSLAQTALEECSFWIHAHIARNITS